MSAFINEIEDVINQEQKLIRKIIQKKFPNPLEEGCTEFNEISSLQDRIILGAVITNTLDKSFSYLKSHDSVFDYGNNKLLTPSLAWDKEIYYNIMPFYFEVAGNSNIDAFDLADFSYCRFKVNWYPNFTDIIKNKSLNNICCMPKIKNGDDLIEIFELWKKILLEELIQNYITKMNDVGFTNYKIDKTTRKKLALLLEKLPLCKIVNVLCFTTDSVCRYYKNNCITKKHAANTVLRRTESFVEKTIIEDKKIKDSIRNKNCPPSALSVYFFKYVVPIFDKAFFTIPSLDIIKKFYRDPVAQVISTVHSFDS